MAKAKFRFIAFLFASFLLILTTPTSNAGGVDATWICTDGQFDDPACWSGPDPGEFPCNGAQTYFVTIDAPGSTIQLNRICTVTTFTLGNDTTFLGPGEGNFTVLGQANIAGIIDEDGGFITAPIASFVGDRARVYSRFAPVEIGATSYSSVGLNDTNYDLFVADGPNAVVDLDNLASIEAGFLSFKGNGEQRIRAANGGTIDLASVGTIEGPQDSGDKLLIQVADATSLIDFAGLSGFAPVGSGTGFTYFDIDQATIPLPNLGSFSFGVFDLSDGASVSAGVVGTVSNSIWRLDSGATYTQVGAVSIYSSTRLTFSDGQPGAETFVTPIMQAADASTLLDLESFQLLDASFAPNSDDINEQVISVTDNAEIDLSGVQILIGPDSPTDSLRIEMSSLASTLHLDSLTQISSGGSGRTIFDLSQDASLEMPSLESIDRAVFSLTGSFTSIEAGFPTERLETITDTTWDAQDDAFFSADSIDGGASYSSTGLTFTEGLPGATLFSTVLMRAEGEASLDVPLAIFDAGYPQNSDDINRQEVIALNEGEVGLGPLQFVQCPTADGDWLRFSAVDGGRIDFGTTDTPTEFQSGNCRLEASLGGLIFSEPVSGTVHIAIDGGGLEVDGLLSLVGSTVDFRNTADAEINFFDALEFEATQGTTVTIHDPIDFTIKRSMSLDESSTLSAGAWVAPRDRWRFQLRRDRSGGDPSRNRLARNDRRLRFSARLPHSGGRRIRSRNATASRRQFCDRAADCAKGRSVRVASHDSASGSGSERSGNSGLTLSFRRRRRGWLAYPRWLYAGSRLSFRLRLRRLT